MSRFIAVIWFLTGLVTGLSAALIVMLLVIASDRQQTSESLPSELPRVALEPLAITVPDMREWAVVRWWWVEELTFENTDPFEISSDLWRISWKADTFYSRDIFIMVFREKDGEKHQVMQFYSDEDKSRSFVGPGIFSLRITTTMTDCEVTVEQPCY